MTHPTIRFPAPVSTSRPRGTRRIDVYSPKLQRGLQCFDETSYRQCLFLEADPSVRVYCERPAFLEIGNERRLADFWVKYADREWFLFLGDNPYSSMARIESREYEVRAVPPAELAAAWIWIENWERILPVVTSCQGLVTAPLLDTVRRFVCSPTPLTRI
jgi:hypothetical protein